MSMSCVDSTMSTPYTSPARAIPVNLEQCTAAVLVSFAVCKVDRVLHARAVGHTLSLTLFDNGMPVYCFVACPIELT